ncbi:hypothetical protein LWI28_000519 [Acer negundo]|uniref:AB hydrolase-1 domain-containing protein n=1 Tax=Acer negundo TaxID=4023 RepID=A0AAD5JNT2_ACENE|nr:hypothetical protein LWI28_000519 [Acer negundo]
MSEEKLHFVLVHGAGHGAWCWYKLRCLMETSGYKVTCLDLKGAGIDQTDPETISSFDEYNQPLIDFFLHLPENHKVILVGHSAGGLNVTDCIHKFGTKKIHMAFYVAANMLKNGFVTDQDYKDGLPEISGLGKITYPQTPTQDSILVSMLLRPSVKAILRAQFTDGPDADKNRDSISTAITYKSCLTKGHKSHRNLSIPTAADALTTIATGASHFIFNGVVSGYRALGFCAPAPPEALGWGGDNPLTGVCERRHLE